ncbi:hypothetical protein OIU77_029699 [Salix suchowensis]|uniref:Uncharacterized protein n=1 Tax=Salix suchowensis TaxID=1278906 RepID=A0ABQ9BB54_9ROSI|nr:hypothetical protein OIU77_029699 [Salix suchowensis]
MRNKLRIWWPHQLASSEPATPLEGNNLLFGWFVSCSPVSVDVVVAFACNEASFSHSDSTLQEILRGVNGKMPVFLQERAAFSLLAGICLMEMMEGLVVGAMNLMGRMDNAGKSLLKMGFGFGWCMILVKDMVKTFTGFLKLHHLHWNGQIVSHCNVHVVVYEIPVYGVHHFSLNLWEVLQASERSCQESPKWVNELEKNQPLLDLDTVILAINSAAAARLALETRVGFKRSISVFFNISSRSIAFMWQQGFSALHGTQIQIRCCQILYWHIILQDNGLRSHSCVEYMENTALHRHSMWSSLAVDLLLGNLMGLALLVHAESVCQWILTFASVITNELLRSGSVWLMGVPAGLALLGILFGATIPAALIIDMVYIATLHVSTLHRFISLLYSWQIQALAALWRLFRGRKWNPLRQRLDSYDYTVKQHIVGSLLFTPLLLLLPTTSVFYMFFTILSTAIAFTCILIEITISMIHSTPYIKIFLWLMRRRRFPSGIWFEIASCQNDSLEFACHDKVCSSSEKSYRNNNRGRDRSTIMVSVLRSNFLSIGQVVLPHYRKVFSGVSDFAITSAHGALTGKRTVSTLGICLPSSTMPWLSIPAREYWRLCHNSVLACMEERDCNECQ